MNLNPGDVCDHNQPAAQVIVHELVDNRRCHIHSADQNNLQLIVFFSYIFTVDNNQIEIFYCRISTNIRACPLIFRSL
jgi:hypothetical protein